MELNIVENVNSVSDESIKNRIRQSSKTRYTLHYVFQRKIGEALAFLSIDVRPNVDYLVLYEIFVPPGLRENGIGSRALIQVESLAKKLGLKRIALFPKPFEKNISKEKLIAWYKNRGFIESNSCPDELEKVI